METAYDGQGNPYLITSYDSVTGGTIVNQIQQAYNGLGQMAQEWQATSGAVNTSTTPSVQYGYSFVPSGTNNHSRLTSITYPNGRVLTYNYATGLADNISRLSSISDGATTLESFDYLGLGTVVRRAHAQTGVDLTYVKLTGESDGAAGDKYIGLDAFGRVVDQRWTTSGGTTADRFGYAYDRDSNRLYKENLVSASNSELYSYDNLNQLSSFQRGTLNGTKTGLTGSATRSQSWDFDALGNFDSQTTDGTTQTRTANKQNEIASISGATTPTYDANGNLTKDETGRTFTYDAWNRLATVKDSGGTLLATYKWDCQGRRVEEVRGSTTTDLYYSDQWQVLEERVGGVARFSYAWSPVYVDAMIARDRDTDANGTLDERLYGVQDSNFNVTALINTSGTVVERYQYDPFGKFSVLDGAWAGRGSSSYGWNYLHQGGRWDADGGVYSFRNRELSPTLGRWLQMDPIGFDAGDSNFYRYEGNLSGDSQDPSGLEQVIVDNRAKIAAAYAQAAQQMRDYGGVRAASVDPAQVYLDAIRKLGVDHYDSQQVPSMMRAGDIGTYEGLSYATAGIFAAAAIREMYRKMVINMAKDLVMRYGPGVIGTLASKGFDIVRNSKGVIVKVLKNGKEVSRKEMEMLERELAKHVNCFPPDTLVETESGLRPISQIEAGEKVWSYDFENGFWKLCRVECRHDANYNGLLVTLHTDSGQATSTAHHPFWVIQGEDLAHRPTPKHVSVNEDQGGSLLGRWVDSHELREGDLIFSKELGTVTIRRLVRYFKQTTVCNLTVEELHTFAVGELQILVHNTSGSLGTSEAIAQHLIKDSAERFGKDAGAIKKQVDRVINSGISQETKSGAVLSNHNGISVIRRPDGTGTMVKDPKGNWYRNKLAEEGIK